MNKKYKNNVFNFYNHGANLEVFENSKEIREIFEAFIKILKKYNLLLNEQIKNYNKTKDLQCARNIHKILSIIHPTLTNVENYNEYIQIYSK